MTRRLRTRPADPSARPVVTYGLHLADLDRQRNKSHGIINYSIGLAAALSHHLHDDERLVVYANPAIADELGDVDRSQTTIHLVRRPANAAHRLYVDAATAWRSRGDGVAILHYPKGILPLVPLRSCPRLVSTIHDDIPAQYARGALAAGGWRSRLPAAGIALLFRRSLRGSSVTITDSDRSRHALLARATGARRPEVRVVRPGVSLPDIPALPIDRRAPRILHLASLHPHKQTSFTIEAVLRYLDDRSSDLELLLVGSVPPTALLDDPRVHHRPATLSNEEIAHLMAESRVIAFPSSLEGFGLPPVEGWHYGTPSVFRSAPALTEMTDTVPGLMRDGSYAAFAAALDEVLALDDGTLDHWRTEVRGASSWAGAADQVLSVYRTAPGRNRRHRPLVEEMPA